VKNFQPNAWIDSLESETSTNTISSTMTKIESAQTSINPPNAPSANRPELLACRKLRMTEGPATATSPLLAADIACSAM
jgi:hypothetical protein